MRILQLCSAREYIGEAGRVVDLCTELRARGHEAELLGRRGYSVLAAAAERGLPTRALHLGSRFHPWREIQDLRAIRARIREFAPAVVHAHRGKDHWLAAAALGPWRRRIPLVRSRHVVTPIRDHLANRWLYGRRTARLLCASQAVARAAAEGPLRRLPPVRVVPGGVDPQRLAPSAPQAAEPLRRTHDIPAGRPVVLCLARLAPVKGQEHLLRAAPAVLAAAPETLFVLAYPRQSGYRQRLEALAGELGIAAALRWVGPGPALGDLLALGTVGVLCSVGSEGWSRATVEMMGAGLPVVASRVGSLPEILVEGETGFLVPPRQPEPLADRLGALVADAALRQRLGAAARRRVAERFTRARLAEGVLTVYNEVLKEFR